MEKRKANRKTKEKKSRRYAQVRRALAWFLAAAFVFGLLSCPVNGVAAANETTLAADQNPDANQDEAQSRDPALPVVQEVQDDLVTASSQPYSGCVWLNIPGYYQTSDTLQQEILDEVNRIRYEACSEGFPNPNNPSVLLTLDDYQPVQWSSALETVSLLRAAEAVQLTGHVRPCSGNGPLKLAYDDYPIRPNYENLAWNWAGMMAGITQWYGEKSNYLAAPGYNSNTGHYVAMIDPEVTHIGFSCYYSTAGRFRYTICGEFAMNAGTQDSTFLAASEPENANVSVKESFIKSVTVSDTETHPVTAQIAPGETTQLRADATYAFKYNDSDYSGSGQVTAGGTWSSSNPSVATVSGDGLVTAISAGVTEISCTVGTVTGTWNLTVDGITVTQALEEVSTASGTAPVLPESVEASWLLGGTTTESITWPSELPADYMKRAGGSYTISGTLTNYPDVNVNVTVNVAKASVASVTGYSKTLITESGTAPAFSPTATVLWSNGEQETVDITWPDLTHEQYSMRSGGTLTAYGSIIVYVSKEPATYEYQQINLTCTVTVKPAMITEIIDPEPISTFTGHRPTGLPSRVSVKWSNGDESEENVSWSIISASSYASAGSFTVSGVVSGSSLLVTLTVNVVDPKVTGIRWIEGKIPRSEYIQGQDLELSEIMIIADFEDGSTEEVATNQLIITGYNPDELGDQNVYFNYNRDGMHQLSLKVKVREKRLVSVEWDTLPAKTVYVEGQVLDIGGGKVKLTYDDDSTEIEDVYNSMLPGVTVLEYTGEYDVTFYYMDVMTSKSYPCPFSIEVVERNPESIRLSKNPTRTEYVEGDAPDLTGGELIIQYNDGTTETVAMTSDMVHVSAFSTEPGDQTVTVYVLTTENEEVTMDLTFHFREKRVVEPASDKTVWGSGENYVIACQDADLLTAVLMDGEALPADACLIEDGTLIIKDTYLKSLDFGEHEITLSWADETRTASFSSVWPFSDVDPASGKWYVDPVRFVYERGIMTGKGGTTDPVTGQSLFGRSETITRRDFAVIVYRMAGSPDTEGMENPFTDLKLKADGSKYYYHDAMIWCADAGIVTGFGDGTCRPKDDISRVQMALMLQRFAEYLGEDVSEGADLSVYPDVKDVPKWGRDGLAWAVQMGIVTGKEDKGRGGYRLAAKDSATRAECAAMIMRFLECGFLTN